MGGCASTPIDPLLETPKLSDGFFKGGAVWGQPSARQPEAGRAGMPGCLGVFGHMQWRHYRTLGLLLLADIARHLPGSLRNANTNFLLPALHVYPTEWFEIVGIAPTLIPACMDLVLTGELVDTTHRPRLLAFGIGVSSALQLVLAGVVTVPSLVLVSSFASLTNALVTPTCLSLIFSHLPLAASAFASSVVFSSFSFGGLICDAIVSIVGPSFQTGFLLIGFGGLTIAVACLFLHEMERPIALQLKDVPPSLARQYALFFRTLKRAPIFVLVFLLFFLEGCMGAANLNMQLWLVRERGFEREHAARFTMWTCLPAIVGYWLFGYLSDELAPRVHRLVFASALHVVASICMLFVRPCLS